MDVKESLDEVRPVSFRVAAWVSGVLPLQLAAVVVWFALSAVSGHSISWPGGTLAAYVVVLLDVVAWMVSTGLATASVRRIARLAGRPGWAITASLWCQLGFTVATVWLVLPAV